MTIFSGWWYHSHLCCILWSIPVCHHKTFKSPLITCDVLQHVIVVCWMNSVDQIVGSHNCIWLCCLYSYLKSFQIDFSQRTLADMCIRKHTVVFLIISCKMFDCCSLSFLRLNTFRLCCSTKTCQYRILRIVFEVSSTKRITMNIHARCEP